MKIDIQEAKHAGSIFNQLSWSDKELSSLIATTEIVIGFLAARGSRWSLALSPLRQDLENLERCADARKRKD